MKNLGTSKVNNNIKLFKVRLGTYNIEKNKIHIYYMNVDICFLF